MLAAVEAFQTHLALFEREGGLPYLRIVDLTADLTGAAPNFIAESPRNEFTEPAYTVSMRENPEFSASHLRFQYESFVTPRSIFDYDVQTRERRLRKQQPILGGYDPAQYASERLHATASDGTRVPLSIVHCRDTPRDGSAPLLLYGYGSYGISLPVNFSSNRLSLTDPRVIYAAPHVRPARKLRKPCHPHS